MKRKFFLMLRLWYDLGRNVYSTQINARPLYGSGMRVFREGNREPTPLESSVTTLTLGRIHGFNQTKLKPAGYCHYTEGSKKPIFNMSVDDPKLRSIAEKYCEVWG